MTEQSPFLSPDGHRLFFDSDRAGGCGGPDLYVSRRRDGHDDLGWSPPVNLGCVVNTEIRESGASFFEDENTGLGVLFFVREPGAIGGADIYVSHEQADGRFSAGVPVRELSSPFTDRFPRVTAAGLQILLSSNRPGGLGGIDTWISTRSTTDDAWSPPVNIGSPINTSFGDGTATLSARGDEMYFYSNRPGGLGGATFGGDLYVSARDRGGSP
jgi:Tol biopolymer transport system component